MNSNRINQQLFVVSLKSSKFKIIIIGWTEHYYPKKELIFRGWYKLPKWQFIVDSNNNIRIIINFIKYIDLRIIFRWWKFRKKGVFFRYLKRRGIKKEKRITKKRGDMTYIYYYLQKQTNIKRLILHTAHTYIYI